MFTIKHIHGNGETLFIGNEPRFEANMQSSDGQTVSYENAHGVRVFITGGGVYIMNEQGRTVAKYALSGPGSFGSEVRPLHPPAVA